MYKYIYLYNQFFITIKTEENIVEKIAVEVTDPEIEAIIKILKNSRKGALSSAVKTSLLFLFTKEEFRENAEMFLADILPFSVREKLKEGKTPIEILTYLENNNDVTNNNDKNKKKKKKKSVGSETVKSSLSGESSTGRSHKSTASTSGTSNKTPVINNNDRKKPVGISPLINGGEDED